MKVLLTGATGFLGKFLLSELEAQQIEVDTIGRSSENTFQCDLAKDSLELPSDASYDMVVHNAGKAHFVPQNEAEGKVFYDVNVGGTEKLLDAILSLINKPKCFVFVSTVAVYGLELGENIDETAPLLGNTPYAKSKIMAEDMIQTWCAKNGVNCVILRLPLVVGENAPGNLGAMEKAIRKGYYFRLGSGLARRSMVNAVDVAKLIPSLIEMNGVYNLTDGLHRSYAEMDTLLAHKHGTRIKKIPVWLGKMIAKVGDFIPGFPLNTYRFLKLEQNLTFSDLKAQNELKWRK
jgi:nucleoside-diphosphate-sugar epimerase